MSTTTKSMRSYRPKRARAKRTCSWMALSTPTWLSTCATTTTSPIHEGVEGRDAGTIWIVTAVCVILGGYPPCLERDQQTFSILRRHISSVFASSPYLLFSYASSLRIPWAVSSAPYFSTLLLSPRPFRVEVRRCFNHSGSSGIGLPRLVHYRR